MSEFPTAPSGTPAAVIDLAAVRSRREQARRAAFEDELRRRLGAFLDAPGQDPGTGRLPADP